MDLLEVVNRRSVPGILILDHRKKPCFFNSTALDYLLKFKGPSPLGFQRADRIPIPKEISNLYDLLKKRSYPPEADSNEDPSSNNNLPCEVVLISTPDTTYCCRGFFLQKPFNTSGKTFHVLILIEKILPSHPMDLQKLKEGFDLTDRQIEILKQLVTGAMNKEIADALCVSEDTIKGHLKNIMKRLGAHSRTEILSKIFQP